MRLVGWSLSGSWDGQTCTIDGLSGIKRKRRRSKDTRSKDTLERSPPFNKLLIDKNLLIETRHTVPSPVDDQEADIYCMQS